MIAPASLLPLVVGVPFLAALLALLLAGTLGRRTGLLMVGAAGVALGCAAAALPHAPVTLAVPWIPVLGIELRLRGDAFALFFALVVAGVGVLVGAYSTAYVADLPARRLGRYYAALIAFMGSMLGLVLADDLVVLFVFWELTSVTSFLLIGFWYEREEARRGAITALQVTAAGGLALLAGVLLIGGATGTYALGALAEDAALRARLAASPACLPALLLVLLAAFTKSAQAPFHFWLPGAMVAPTPVSAYLHAATMVKAGIFLLARLLPVFGEHPAWSPLLVGVGLVTFVLGAWQAFHEWDLKAMLARTTVSALGMLTLVYGLRLGGQDALQVLSHAAYKGGLFLVAGIVEHATHTRDIRRLGGLAGALPVTFGVAVVAALSMAGLPPLLGFLAKEALYEGVLHTAALGDGVPRALVLAGTVLANALTVAVALRLVAGVFLGPRRTPVESHGGTAEPVALWAPPAVLAALALALGALGATAVTERLVNGWASDPTAHVHVSLVALHGTSLLLSALTTGLGIVLYLGRAAVPAPALPDAQRLWERAIEGVYRFAERYSAWWQNGSMRWYLSVTLGFAAGLLLFGLDRTGVVLGTIPVALGDAPWYGVAIAALTGVASVAVARARTRLGAALALTAVGLFVSLIFVVYRSPDILLTQILIETVSTIFILLVLFFMPPFRRDGLSPAEKTWNVLVSSAVGLAMFLFVLLATAPDLRETRNLAGEYLSRALDEAGGANAVNVIIVDFRAMDTIGEVTVLVVVALCVFGLLRARRARAT